MWAIVLKVVMWALGKMFGGNADATVQAGAAVTKEQASQVEKENAVLKAAAAARAGHDAELVRNDPHGGEVHPDRNDPINLDPNLHLRD